MGEKGNGLGWKWEHEDAHGTSLIVFLQGDKQEPPKSAEAAELIKFNILKITVNERIRHDNDRLKRPN